MAIDYDTLAPEHQEYVHKMFGQTVQCITVEKPKPSKPTKERGVPNQLEQDFRDSCKMHLDYESVTFHLTRSVSYTPDWLGHPAGALMFFEVKLDTSNMNRQAKSRLATQNRESLTKLKICAERYPEMLWYLAKKRQGMWRIYPVTSSGIASKPVEVAWLNGRA